MVKSEQQNLMIQDVTWTDRPFGTQTCVVIPTYNNAFTLAAVIADVRKYTDQVIVVNDGSTDQTDAVLASIEGISLVSYPQNRGKGWALRKGFERALALGYQYAISFDADSQHLAKDLPILLDTLGMNPQALVVGARNMNQGAVPSKSSFGKSFSNFWFLVETGVRCSDTQSGLRLYPILELQNVRFFTRKYEFEIEILVRAAWKGIPIKCAAVGVYYPPKNERVSHFRPFRDFARISVLNTLLVLFAAFYIFPRNLLRKITKGQNWKRVLNDELLQPQQPDYVKAISIGLGLCVGILPIWGFQLIVAILLAILLKLNRALMIVAANISIPPMIPLIIFCSYKTGGIIMDGRSDHLTFSSHISLESVSSNIRQYLLGSVILAFAVGVVGGILSLVMLKSLKKSRAISG